MKKLKLKRSAIIGAYLIAFALTGMSAFYVSQNMKKNIKEEEIEYVNTSVIDNIEDKEVIKEEQKLKKPVNNDEIEIVKYFYDYQADNSSQEKSILYHENTYIQNSGVDFSQEEVFDVISVLDGTVINVRDDDLLGKIVEIKHDNDFISSYQSLSEITVKKNDQIKQGQIIGKSGTNKTDQDLGNHLHFELYKKGEIVDPIKYFDQVITNNNEEKTNIKTQETE